ncbi:MAG TPA: helicase HerA-like domain-containing protein, partial [Gammaproteobacteria bacterium]|nr:helicase HerA-like domain-containing protein [Gammaproteobacteria bacterium]
AYELLQKKAQEKPVQATEETADRKKATGRQRQGVAEALIKSAARSIGSQLGRQLIRGILGSLTGKK